MKISFSTVLIYFATSVIIALFSVNAVLTLLSLLILLVSLKLVWRANEPPILPFIIGYHWFQVSTKIFHANVLRVPVQNLGISASTESAIYLSLLGLVVISLGFYLVTRGIKPLRHETIQQAAKSYSTIFLLKIYVVTFVAFIFLKQVLFVIPQLTQLIFGILSFKRVLLYFIFIVCLVKKDYRFLAFTLITEVLLGLTGFFSEFKEPFFILLLAYFTLNTKISLPALRYFLPLTVVFFVMVLAWTAIKAEYREKISGANSMVISVSISEQVDILVDNVSEVDADLLGTAVESVARRLSYVDFFGRVIDYVPQQVSFENGKLWGGAITHIFKPRFLFPNKGVLDDSKRTTKYTGFLTAGVEQGTSIGIGYFAESYIDFGPNFMFVPLFFMGIFYGLLYRILIKTVRNPILAFAMIVTILIGAYLFEIRNDKLFGGIVSAFLVLKVLQVTLLNKLFETHHSSRAHLENMLR